MAIVTPTDVGIIPQWQLLLPQMADEPLLTALRNLNYLHRYHQPALVSACPTSDPALTRTSEYHIPIIPSADGIRYTYEVRFVCSAATQNVTVAWDYSTAYAGGGTVWTNITSNVVVTGGAGTLTTRTDTAIAIPATADCLRVSLSAPGAGSRTDHHFLVYPAPAAATAAVYASGFRPFDDGLFLSADGAPVHTEWLNRLKASAAAILTDRKQCAFSFVQEYTTTPRYTKNSGNGVWREFPMARCFLPNQQGPVTLAIRAIGKVSAGANADLLRIAQVGQDSVTLDASGSIESASLNVYLDDAGLLRGADLQCGIDSTAGGNVTKPYAIMAYWTPGS